MRRFIRPATPEEENTVKSYIAKNEMLLGVHKDQDMYAVRQPDGAVRYIDFAVVKPTVTQRIVHFLSGK